MWHEARKQERRIRGMLVDYRKRAERRRDFYEKIKADPTQFLQLHGRQCKIHLDPAVAAAADSPAAMMPWQGHSDNLIDRFDVRAHLDFIPPVKKPEDEELNYEERQLNYERYRIIAQNSFLGITEEKFLKQLHLEEQFGYTETEPKKKKSTGAAIGFNYEDGTAIGQASQLPQQSNSSDEQSDSDLDVDLSINVSKIDSTQAHEMNRHGRNFGMSTNDFYSFLTNDLEEAENYRLAKEEEHEKALFSGRKSRRERRAHREKRLANRVISPPSYAARTSPTYPMFRESKSASKSPSPENSGKITYITSFGDDDEPTSSSKATYADKVKYGKAKRLSDNPGERRIVYIETKRRSRSRDVERSFPKRGRSRSNDARSPKVKPRRSRSPNRYRRSRSRNRSRRYRSRRSSSSSSRSLNRSRRRDRSTSRSVSKYKSRSRNRSYSRSRSGTRSRSRSKSKNVVRVISRNHANNPVAKTSSRSSSSSSDARSVNFKKSPSRSRSGSTKSSMSVDRSRSRSVSMKRESPPKIIPRYYGRKRSDQSSSDLSDGVDGEEKDVKPDMSVTVTSNKSSGNSGSTTKKFSTSLSLQERLKRKRQAQLNKQFKADKIAEQLKTEREKQEQQNREDELREMAIKLRRRQRERRHAYDSNSSSSSDSEAKPRSPASASEGRRSKSSSPRSKRDDREFKSRDAKYRYRDGSRERSREREGSNGKRSPKSRHDSERRVVYRVDGDREKNYRRREDSRRDKDSFKSKEPGRSLVDY